MVFNFLALSLFAQDPQFHQFIQKNHFEKAIERAFALHQADNFDASSAEKLSSSLIDKGLNSVKVEENILSLYAAMICEKVIDINKLDNLFRLEIPAMQHMILNIVHDIDPSSAYPIIKNALSSMDLGVRLHACQILAHSGNKEGLGQLESLMYRLPKEFRYIFADLFAQIGSKEAQMHLKTLLEDTLWTNRVAALLAVAEFRQDGLIDYLKSSISHTQPAEIEAAAYGLGTFGEVEAIKKLTQLLDSKVEEIKLASAFALSRMGIEQGKEVILEEALQNNHFAQNLLPFFQIDDEKLSPLFKNSDITSRLNITRSLVKKRHKTGLLEAYSLLQDLPPLLPKHSSGRTLLSFRIEKKKEYQDYAEAFRKLFASELIAEIMCYPHSQLDPYLEKLVKIKEWIPLVINGLLDRGDQEAILLLKKFSETLGNPYLRTYAHLALFEKNESMHHKNKLLEYINQKSSHELIRFKPGLKKDAKYLEMRLEPTPEEQSELYIRSLAALSSHKDPKIIKALLEVLEKGNPSNRPIIAAFLLLSLR